MRRYSAQGSQSAALTDTILGMTSATTVRPKVYEVLFGSSATPADQAFRIACQRNTAAGTSTAVTPVPWDSADPASLCAAGQAHSVEPTYTSGLVPLQFAINQQATFRWVVLPEYGIVLPATAANGLGAVPTVVSGGTPNLEMQFTWME